MSVADRIAELRKRYEENPRRFFAPLANEYRKSGDLEQAILLCQEHLPDQPANMNGHVVYGQTLFEAGRFEEAAVTFETALSLDPENLIALRHLGDMARDRGDASKAREWYRRVLDADPRNEEILGFLQQMDGEPGADAETAAPAPVEPSGEAAVESPPRVAARPTPVVPYRALDEAPTPPGPTLGLMDLSIDLGLNAEVAFDQTSEPALEVSGPAPEDERPAPADDGFASIGFPVETAGTGPTAEVPSGAEAAAARDVGDAPWPRVEEVVPPPEAEVAAAPSAQSGDVPEVREAAFADLPATEIPAAVPIDNLGSDFLYPDTISDFPTVGGEGSAVGSDVGAKFDVDALIGRTPATGIEGIEPIAETPQPFVNETMAELYLQQGFRDEALRVYRQLSAQDPHDDSLRERIASLEHGGRSSLSFDLKHEEKLDVAEGSVPLGAMLEMTPHEVVEEAHLHPRPEKPVRTARAFFAALAGRRAVAGEGTPSADGAAQVASSSSGGLAPGALDAMFGGAVGGDDEAMARTLASVAEGVERAAPSVKGKPTQAAATELSLDAVFRDAPRRPSGPVPRQSQNLRFDQFFSSAVEEGSAGGDTSGSAEGAPPDAGDAAGADRPAAPGAGEPGSPADLEKFQSWLSGLKMP